jgi:hypothetical protein
MPPDEARSLLERLQEKAASSDIEVRHRDVLIRLRSMIEEDLEAGIPAITDAHREKDRTAAQRRGLASAEFCLRRGLALAR